MSINTNSDTIENSSKSAKQKVAIYSTKSVSWYGIGEVIKGYNIVTKANAEKWLERDHIRIATPEEVAREYGL